LLGRSNLARAVEAGTVRLATADYSFPLLEWPQAVRLASELAFQGIDISVFQGRSHLKPEEVLAKPSAWGATVRKTLNDNGLEVADVFGIPGARFDEAAPNHPSAAERAVAKEYFHRLLEFALRCGAKHMTILPGIHFETEDREDSLKRCAEELQWRSTAARALGICFAVEAHTGSILATPALTQRLLELAPDLTLTLDPGHFAYQGVADTDILPLIGRASHFHARCGCPGKLQAPLTENSIDFAAYVRAFRARGYAGWLAVEYVWIDWERCNEVDILSETILLRNLLRSF